MDYLLENYILVLIFKLLEPKSPYNLSQVLLQVYNHNFIIIKPNQVASFELFSTFYWLIKNHPVKILDLFRINYYIVSFLDLVWLKAFLDSNEHVLKGMLMSVLV